MGFGGKKAVGKIVKLKESEYVFYGVFWRKNIFKIASYEDRRYSLKSIADFSETNTMSVDDMSDFELIDSYFDIGL